MQWLARSSSYRRCTSFSDIFNYGLKFQLEPTNFMSLVPLCLFFLTISRFILVTLLKVYNFITHKKIAALRPGKRPA